MPRSKDSFEEDMSAVARTPNERRTSDALTPQGITVEETTLTEWLRKVTVKVPSEWCRSHGPLIECIDIEPMLYVEPKKGSPVQFPFSCIEPFYFGSLDLLVNNQLRGLGDIRTSGILVGKIEFDSKYRAPVLDVRTSAVVTRRNPQAHIAKGKRTTFSRHFTRSVDGEKPRKGLLKVVLEHGDVISYGTLDYSITYVNQGHPSFWNNTPFRRGYNLARLRLMFPLKDPGFVEIRQPDAYINQNEWSDRQYAQNPELFENGKITYEALINLGKKYDGEGNFDLALKCWEAAVPIHPEWAWAFTTMGDAYYYRGQLPVAISYFNEALRRDPNCKYTIKRHQEVMKLIGTIEVIKPSS